MPAEQGELPPLAHAVALSTLPGMGPGRLRALLRRWEPPAAWHAVLTGRAGGDEGVVLACRPHTDEVVRRWRAAAGTVDVEGVWAAHLAAGVRMDLHGTDGFPAPLADDPAPPAVLFAHGDLLGALERPRVAIVGTRRCTGYGRDLARELGRGLAEAGVTVVSGLALGIDGAAHAGALEAGEGAGPPVAVVGCGLDIVYPRRHLHLWQQVLAAGAIVSEAPLGARAEAWRFPARNRIIAGLAHVVVVVESALKGGSMHTVDAALQRARPVLAVPGSVRSPASAGTNQLLSDGAAPARNVDDVLIALGLEGGDRHDVRPELRRPPDRSGSLVLDALGWEPATTEIVADRLGEPLGPVAVTLAGLEDDGWVRRTGPWWERVA